MARASGVLMHVSSLWGEYGSGSFGKEACRFIDFLVEAGFSYWQVLPFCAPDEYNSPYKSDSSFSGNYSFVDLPTLAQKGLLSQEELEEAKQASPYLCEFDRLKKERFALLKKAAARVKDRREIENFIAKEPHLLSYCRFMTLREANGGKPWQEWSQTREDPETLFAWKFIQFEFFTQWQAVRRYAQTKGVKIIGDVPIYVSADSADVWSDPGMFQLDERGYPLRVAGVSPDYFCEDGQLWGNPLYDWKAMKQDGYRWWKDRIAFMAKLFDGVRIDHFRAFASYWAVPASAQTAKEGKWVKGPGMPLVRALKEAAGKMEIIAEDLGDITPDVVKLVKDSGFPGMRVFQFGFLGEKNSTHLPHNYPANCVAYTGTHDNNTLLGYLWELDDAARARMLSYCGHTGDWGKGCESILRTVMASHADLAVFPIQDLLGYGCDTRLNTPGKAENNWAYRVTAQQLQEVDKERFLRLNQTYCRI